MRKIKQEINFVLELAKTQAMLARRFDAGLGGLGLSEFIILQHLSLASGEKMRRIDLACKIGLTASGITRLLLPMEKIGLVKSGESENDARARFVMIAAGGKRKLEEATERMELLLKELLPTEKKAQVQQFAEFLSRLQAQIYLN